jgi:hypothetical protein
MKIPGVALAVVVAAGVGLYFHASGSTPTAPTIVQSASPASDARVAQLTTQVEALQRSLSALQSQLARKQASAPDRAVAAKDSQPPELDVAAQRDQELERRRLYMAGVAAGFNDEKIDPAWAARVASRVSATFEGNEELRKRLRGVECRTQTCRVQMDEDGSVALSRQMPFLSLSLVDVLPSMSVDHIDQGNGHSTMILYMSSQGGATSGMGK